MIRKVNVRDLGDLLKLLHQLSPPKQGGNHIDQKGLARILNNMIGDRNYYICVCERGNKLVGTAMLLIQLNLSHNGRPYGHIENVVTNKDFRKKGIGGEMIKHLMDKAKKANCYKVILNCEKFNIPFYKECGFTKTGEIEMRID